MHHDTKSNSSYVSTYLIINLFLILILFIMSACVLQRSRHLQRVVRRCAMRWKQRALCTPRREQEVKEQSPKKSVSFCLTTSGRNRVSPSDSEGQEAEDGGRSEL